MADKIGACKYTVSFYRVPMINAGFKLDTFPSGSSGAPKLQGIMAGNGNSRVSYIDQAYTSECRTPASQVDQYTSRILRGILYHQFTAVHGDSVLLDH